MFELARAELQVMFEDGVLVARVSSVRTAASGLGGCSCCVDQLRVRKQLTSGGYITDHCTSNGGLPECRRQLWQG
jgi:hypothetical protein